MAWDDDKRAKAVELYQAENPTPETSIEIVKKVADELEESPNGVRSILSKAEVYIKKSVETSTGTTPKEGTTKRVSKADQQASLISAITDVGGTVDESIIDKLSGKAAGYLAGVINAINATEEDED